jgi:hypothetical protein
MQAPPRAKAFSPLRDAPDVPFGRAERCSSLDDRCARSVRAA